MNSFPKRIWYLYNNTAGAVVLKHPYSAGALVPCPYCGVTLAVENYRAACCGKTFRTSFGEIAQREPVEEHGRSHGRGWQSLRPFKQD